MADSPGRVPRPTAQAFDMVSLQARIPEADGRIAI